MTICNSQSEDSLRGSLGQILVVDEQFCATAKTVGGSELRYERVIGKELSGLRIGKRHARDLWEQLREKGVT